MWATRAGRWAVALLAFVVLYVLFGAASLYGDYLWYVSLGYESVFLRRLGYSVAVGSVAAVVSFVVLSASVVVSMRNVARVRPAPAASGRLPGVSVLQMAGVGGLSLFLGLTYAGAWGPVFRYLEATSFGIEDPIYAQDVSFYVFSLPFFRLVVGFLVVLTLLSLAVSVYLYSQYFGIIDWAGPETIESVQFDFEAFGMDLVDHGGRHVAVHVAALLVLAGAWFVLARFGLLFSPRGAVFGVGATDAAVFQPLYLLLAVVALAGGVVTLVGTRLRNFRIAVSPVVALVVLLMAGSVAGAGFQSFVVEPDEFNQEASYIENEIEFTRAAFDLERIDETTFPVAENLTTEQIEANPGTIENIRLWDTRPLLTTYNELQIFRTYYTFDDVDVDRYVIDGRETQVMVASREIDFEALSPESQTWVNRHLVYTHGFGITMSPVSKVSGEGLPQLYVRDIPPTSPVGINVTQPRIYYGERTDTYALVNSGTRELDYPSGDQNVYTAYSGPGGVPLSSTTRELVYAAKFGDPQIVLSGSVTPETRIQFDRDVETRVRELAPFLEYDDDPYMVVSNGRLYWIQDAYTTTDAYPYAKRVSFKGDRVNYVRNAAKVVVDAYTGETTFYVFERDDPVLATYANLFPSLFVDADEMPPDLYRHVRYAEDGFEVQTGVYLDYHMTDSQVFYNKEDSWRVPDEIVRGNRVSMDPYYVIMTFPDGEDPEFVLIRPFIPRGKENMIGWLAARSDPPNYGNMRAFLFSKQRLVFGPMQIESRIDQDTEISQRITLWSQAGSSVIRGNLLAIPVDDTIIYVEPLYLESQESGALPELKRVIVAQGNGLTMQPTLEEALAVRFGTERPSGGQGGGVSAADLERLQTLYDEAQAALEAGDFVTYAEKITELGQELDEIEAEAGNETASSPALGPVPAG